MWGRFRKMATVEARLYNGVETTIPTKLGEQPLRPGDWLIRNPDGEVYPCPADTFLSTYTPAE